MDVHCVIAFRRWVVRMTKTTRFLVVLTAVNLLTLAANVLPLRPLAAQSAPGVLRGTALEIVDRQGRPRATISILSANPGVAAEDGKPFPETVVLRLIDPKYGPVVKLSGSERTAGLGLGGDSQAKYTLLESQPTGSFLKLTDANGREQLIKP
jgi:hypothetical protein